MEQKVRPMHIGSLIRHYRKKKKLTLRSVAEEAGISEGFLSQVENNVNSPSVDTLTKIGAAIGVRAGDLLNQANGQERLVVIRKSEWGDFDIPHTGFATQRFFSPENRAVMDSAILIIQPEVTIPVRKNIKNGQEVICVLKGSLTLFHGEQQIDLEEGDTAHFWADTKKQSINNKNKETAVVLWVGTL
jgi:transcriptional regulator with XRE-family HTH domain